MSKAQRLTLEQRQAVLCRDTWQCVRCATSQGLSAHHRRPGGMGGSRLPESQVGANVITLCGDGTRGCHGHVESHRTWGYAHGFLVPRWADPAAWPVLYMGRQWLQPEDGVWTPARPTEWQRDELELIEEGVR